MRIRFPASDVSARLVSSGTRVLLAWIGLMCLPIAIRAAAIGDESPRPQPRRAYLGAFAGVQEAFSSGSFTTTCACSYSGASGAGPIAGLQLDLPLARDLRLAVALGYRQYSMEYRTAESRLTYITHSGTYMPVDFERTAAVDFAWIGAMVAVEWRPWANAMHATGGLSIGTLSADQLLEEERVQTPGYGYPETGTAQKTFHDGAFGTLLEKRPVQLAADIGAGYDLRIGTDTWLAPRVMFSFPILSIAANQPSWRMPAISFILLMRFGV